MSWQFVMNGAVTYQPKRHLNARPTGVPTIAWVRDSNLANAHLNLLVKIVPIHKKTFGSDVIETILEDPHRWSCYGSGSIHQ